MSLPFLLEIGVEEIPDWMIPVWALPQLKSLFEQELGIQGLVGSAISVDGTPRRLVLKANLPERQEDASVVKRGPPKSAAFKDDVATPVAIGFAKRVGASSISELSFEQTEKGE